MPFAVVLILLVVGSILFHLFSPWTFTPLASNWGMVDFTVDITLWVTGFIFVAVNLFMAVCVIKFRHRKGEASKAKYEPENKKLETWLTALTAVGVAAMLTPGLFVWADFVNVPEEAEKNTVEAVGQQWHWTFRYPGADGKFGEVDAERISLDNPFGMDPDDPNGQDDVLVMHAEAHIPVDRSVKFLLRSKDVLHDFAVAQFRVKMDLVPGMNTFLWLTPTEKGRYEILCEELCGIAHHTMRGAVVVEDAADFDAWLETHPTFAQWQEKLGGNASAGAAQYQVCASCHGPEGQGVQAMNGPKLAGIGDWYFTRQIRAYQDGLRGAHADDAIGRQMAAMASTLAGEAAINNVHAHIQTFPDRPPPVTVEGDAAKGKRLYAVCAYCHGKNGQGNEALNAPRVAGMNDWYLARQLENFKAGVRGDHPQDYYGMQMGFMGRILTGEQAINDVVAYINTLPVAEPGVQMSAMRNED